ncbi:MAG: VacJ family lipoprotein [Pseudomonadota bacterium]
MLLAVFLALAGCAKPPAGHSTDEAFDPYEAQNRKIHNFNVALDRTLVRPVGKGYSNFIPDDFEDMIGRFAENLSIPSAVVNNILQGNAQGAASDTLRFVVNSTVGILGLFDPATEMNIGAPTDADFGQTLHVWGVREGAYIELPILGPSTQRRTVGIVVDLFTNPITYILDFPENIYGTVAAVSSSLSNRGRFSDTIDSILYESADSYAQARSLYIQNRRFKLGNGSSAELGDPYDAVFGPIGEEADE